MECFCEEVAARIRPLVKRAARQAPRGRYAIQILALRDMAILYLRQRELRRATSKQDEQQVDLRETLLLADSCDLLAVDVLQRLKVERSTGLVGSGVCVGRVVRERKSGPG